MTNDHVEQNKQRAMAFYDLTFNKCRPAEAIAQYAGDVYLQHNPEVGDGKEAFVEYFEGRQRQRDVLTVPANGRSPVGRESSPEEDRT